MKDSLISLYVWLVSLFFTAFKAFPLQKKTVFLSSFGNNAWYVANELGKIDNQPVIFLNDSRCRIDFSDTAPARKKVYTFESGNIRDMVMSIYHLATARYVFIDNYVGILSGLRFRRGVEPVQLWHAAGAIKRFGWTDPETSKRSRRAQKRFQAVYDRFSRIPVGSKKMKSIFMSSFNIGDGHFLPTGVPMTDFYFDPAAIAGGAEKVLHRYPAVRGKKIVLYAPTFRKDQLDDQHIPLDIGELLTGIPDDFIVMIRLHPAVRGISSLPEHPRLIDVGAYPNANELLAAADILVTDYSSLPFEYALLRRKMIFHLHDLEEYSKKTGIWADSPDFFPGPIAKTTGEIIMHINDPAVDYNRIERFNSEWNEFSDGRSSRKLIDRIYGQ
ncbi:CDP-glycerol glycerophosphotransferase family protein [Bhargavaea beijingensis]|uniref:CDP-glycerol glycerophosphotransferase, TagB/SpsB family n=1 Tax=Bhargavaea beijingensis TaxID=426756 RepID=A0A1G6ZRX1_9BACL|nr:CDP-glycerol glycerophosphotransferase family protein [Bhargavaea beijingensis]RSK35717.1 teichoic acid biosynthesis protein B [Bhargavaea beijingensis]SDE05289.1 CDP-glycerol glycerophosphotransferase, TagB/SpsB family [Bhargavaea beijingensis]